MTSKYHYLSNCTLSGCSNINSYLLTRMENHYSKINPRRPIKYKLGHILFVWKASQVMLTCSNRSTIPLHFMHLSNEQLFSLKKALSKRAKQATRTYRQLIIAITRKVSDFQNLSQFCWYGSQFCHQND